MKRSELIEMIRCSENHVFLFDDIEYIQQETWIEESTYDPSAVEPPLKRVWEDVACCPYCEAPLEKSFFGFFTGAFEMDEDQEVYGNTYHEVYECEVEEDCSDCIGTETYFLCTRRRKMSMQSMQKAGLI